MEELEKKINYKFNKKDLLNEALTSASLSNENGNSVTKYMLMINYMVV